jgi:ADP-heptose:LPS heptosyltransferase
MKRALFISRNLIGDGLYIQPSLSVWAQQHPDWEIDLLTLGDHITCLYEGMGIPNLHIITKEEERFDYEGYPFGGKYDFEHVFLVNDAFTLGEQEKIHISKAYAKGLGVEIPDNVRVQYQPPEGETEEGLVLLSMFSNSCASRQGKPPNKMLSWAHWLPILVLARQVGKIGALGAPKDECPLPLDRSEFRLGLPLPQVARILRDAKILITIDNGMAHLAASQGTPTVLFYPACLDRSWIIPSGNPNLLVYHMDPCAISASDAMMVVRQGLKKFWRVK